MELLARLDPKTSSWGDTGGSFDPLTASQIAASLEGADPIGLMVLQWSVGQKGRSKGYYMLYVRISGLGWQIREQDAGKERVRSLMEICLDDYASPNKCRPCSGTGQNELLKDCSSCKGSGNKNRSNADRAKQMGVHRSTYQRVWSKQYPRIMNYLLDTLPELEYQANKSIKKHLFIA